MVAMEELRRELLDIGTRITALVRRMETSAPPQDEPGRFQPAMLTSTIGSSMQAAGLAAFAWGKDVKRITRDGATLLRLEAGVLKHRASQILALNQLPIPQSRGGPLTGFTQRGRLQLARIVEYHRDDKGGWYFMDERWLPAVREMLKVRKMTLPN